MSTNLQKQKKETKQVRVSTYWHKALKIEAAERGTTITKLLDDIFDRRREQDKPDAEPP